MTNKRIPDRHFKQRGIKDGKDRSWEREQIKDKGGSIMWTLYRSINGRLHFVQAQISYYGIQKHGIEAAALRLKAARAVMRKSNINDEGDTP
jgi:hypothetical protein